MLTHTHTYSFTYITLGHIPCCLSPALKPREASPVPHRQLLFHGNGHSSSPQASTGLLDRTTISLPLILISCSKAACTVPSIVSAGAVELTQHYPGTGLHPAGSPASGQLHPIQSDLRALFQTPPFPAKSHFT